MQLTAQQKQDYLATMGVESWYPRMRLPHGPAPVVLLESDPEAEPVGQRKQEPQPLPEQAASHTERQPINDAERSTSRAQPVPAQSAPDATPAAITAPATGGSRAIHFGLGLYVIGPWLIVSTLSGNYQAQQDAAFRLLLAILKQFNNQEQEPAYHHVIAWPFFSNPNADQGETAATAYVNGVIEHLVEEHQVTRLLSFGGVLAKLNDWDDAEGGDFGLKRLNLPSLFKMLDDPAQKAKAWQLIQASSLYRS